MKQLHPVVYSGKVGAAPRKPRHTISKRVIKTAYQCQDGPFAGRTLYLESPHTLTMTIKGQTGRYNQGVWECK